MSGQVAQAAPGPDQVVLDRELGPMDVLERMGVPVIVTRHAPGEQRPAIMFVNEAAVRLLGYGRDELLGQGPEFWQSRAPHHADLEAIDAALRTGSKVRLATVARTKDGTERGLRIEMVPHEGSGALWVVGTVLWISDDDPEDTGTIRIAPERPREFAVGDLALDTSTRRVRYGSREVELTPSESVLLATLMDQSGCVVDRALLYEELWGFDSSARSRAIDVYIGSVRSKLRDLGAPEMIHTVRGVGYLLTA
ncbi:MAG: winged helix-turn-helix domain-containing protein [Actinomycetota bacterium]